VAAYSAVDAGAEDTMGDRQWFVLYVVVCLEVGIFLLLVPWSAVWERNYFLEAYPSLRAILLAPAIRGAVAGLGLANIYMGLSEVLNRRRRAPRGNDRGEDNTPAHRQAVVASDDRA
jgi:hypothetical protein